MAKKRRKKSRSKSRPRANEPQRSGDSISVGDISSSQAVAIGRGSTASYIDHADIHVPALPRSKFIPPAAPDELIGRGELCEKIVAKLDENSSVLLHGMGGMGKTAIAATIAAAAHADEEHYPDGVCWLTVVGRSLEDLCDDVFRDEGQPDLAELPAEQKPAQARRLLGNRRLLVVLDDVDEDNPTALEWRRQVQPSNAPLLVTSRGQLTGFEPAAYPVDELAREDAKALLRLHAKQVTDRLSDDQANIVCETLGDHPLAVEIFASLLVAEPLNIQNVLDELGIANEHLAKLRRGVGKSKDDNVEISLKLSWDRLDDDQRHVLARLATFFAPSTGDELLALSCELDEDRFKDARNALYKRSLIRVVNQHWGAHALVRAFVEAKRTEAGEWDADRRAAVRAGVTYAQQHGLRDTSEHDLLQFEHHNLLAAAEWAAGNGMYDEVDSMALYLWGNSLYLTVRSFFHDAMLLLKSAVEATAINGNLRNHIKHLIHLGNAAVHIDSFQEALDAYSIAKEIAVNDLHDREFEASAIFGIGNVYHNLGDLAFASVCFENARSIAVDTGNLEQEANTVGNLGLVLRQLGKIEQAIECHMRQVQVARELGDWVGSVNATGHLAMAYAQIGDNRTANELYRLATVGYRLMGNVKGEAYTLINHASLLANLGKTSDALKMLERAREIVTARRLTNLATYIEENIARLNAVRG